MYSVTVRDHMMIAHSLQGAVFGPAQRLHGATYVVDATVRRHELDADGIVIDIALAAEQLHEVLAELTHRNLDDDPTLAGVNTTTEQLARLIADQLAERLGDRLAGQLPDHDAADGGGAPGGEPNALAITLHESHIAWASYERAL